MDKKQKKSASNVSMAIKANAIVLYLALVFLTAANFFVYADYHFDKKVGWTADAERKQSAYPIEENSNSCKAPTVTEEYLHDRHMMHDPSWRASSIMHGVIHAEQLSVIHYEIVSPPPKAQGS